MQAQALNNVDVQYTVGARNDEDTLHNPARRHRQHVLGQTHQAVGLFRVDAMIDFASPVGDCLRCYAWKLEEEDLFVWLMTAYY